MFRPLRNDPRAGQILWVEIDDYLSATLIDWAEEEGITHLQAEVIHTYEDEYDEDYDEDEAECLVRFIDPRFVEAVRDEDGDGREYTLSESREQYARYYMLYRQGEASVFDRGNYIGGFPRATSPRPDRRRGR